MDGDAVARLQTGEIPQQGRHFIHPEIQFLIGDGDRRVFFRFTYKNEGGFVFVLGEMAVDTVERNIEFAAGKALPERSVAGVERGGPVVVPREQVAIFAEALGEILLA